MENDKGTGMGQDVESVEADAVSEQSPRARNRTVLLTPDITTQVRARIAQEAESHPKVSQEAHRPMMGMGTVPGHDTGHAHTGFMPVGRKPAGEDASSRYKAAVSPGMPAQMTPAPAAVSTQTAHAADSEMIVWTKLTPVVGFMVSFDKDPNGEICVLRSGRLVVSSQKPSSGSYLYLEDESVSGMHAIVRVGEAGEIQVLDQLSENGTSIKRFESDEEIKLSGEKAAVEHGDVLGFGNRKFHVCILAKA